MAQEYVLGFAFTHDLQSVLLVRKSGKGSQSWQKNHLNGVGDRIDEGEFPERAMFRSGRTEAEIFPVDDWKKYGTFHGKAPDGSSYTIHLFMTRNASFKIDPHAEEPVSLHSLDSINNGSQPVVDDVPWLLNLAVQTLNNRSVYGHYEITATRKDAVGTVSA